MTTQLKVSVKLSHLELLFIEEALEKYSPDYLTEEQHVKLEKLTADVKTTREVLCRIIIGDRYGI